MSTSSYLIVVNSSYPRTTLHARARACERISILSCVHQLSRVSNSSGVWVRSSSFTDRALTVPPVSSNYFILSLINKIPSCNICMIFVMIHFYDNSSFGNYYHCSLPRCRMNPVGKFFMVRKGYSRRSKESCVIIGRWIPVIVPPLPPPPPPDDPPLPARLPPVQVIK